LGTVDVNRIHISSRAELEDSGKRLKRQ